MVAGSQRDNTTSSGVERDQPFPPGAGMIIHQLIMMNDQIHGIILPEPPLQGDLDEGLTCRDGFWPFGATPSRSILLITLNMAQPLKARPKQREFERFTSQRRIGRLRVRPVTHRVMERVGVTARLPETRLVVLFGQCPPG